MVKSPSLPASIRFLEQPKVRFASSIIGPVESLEDAAFQRGQSPEQVIRSILFRLSEMRYFMVIIPGRTRFPESPARLLAAVAVHPGQPGRSAAGYRLRNPAQSTPLDLDAESPGSIENCIFTCRKFLWGQVSAALPFSPPASVLRAVPQAIVDTLDDALC
jgi:hypothetical protein